MADDVKPDEDQAAAEGAIPSPSGGVKHPSPRMVYVHVVEDGSATPWPRWMKGGLTWSMT
jgi:hypothetical protein